MIHSPTAQHQINSVYEIAWREREYLLESKGAGIFDRDRWEVFITFLGNAGLHSMASEMKSHLDRERS